MVYTKFVPFENKTCLVKAMSYEGKNLKGTVSNVKFPDGLEFESQMQLFMLMDELYDEINSPQRAMERRSFEGTSITSAPAQPAAGAGGQIATFRINVHFRQNASWQGTITWLEKESEASFRSVLELMMIMDSALSE